MSKKKFIRPLGERILVKPLEHENKSAGGIILGGEETVISSNKGTVLAIGKAVEDVLVNDIVMYGPNSGMLIKGDDSEEYIIIREKDIQGVIE